MEQIILRTQRMKNFFDQLKMRIDSSKDTGVNTEHLRNDYGKLMIDFLLSSGEYVQRLCKSEWRIFHKDYSPYWQ